ncbi:MAG: hypothetical protein LBJ67_04740 [Planctomycetaceae bacterium]|nr:hypothetical protein [Planctomycetaceae bacterium]
MKTTPFDEYGGCVFIYNTIISNNYAKQGAGYYGDEGEGDQPCIATLNNVLLGGNFGSAEARFSPEGFVHWGKYLWGYQAGFIVAPEFDQNGVLINANKIDLRLSLTSLAVDTGELIYTVTPDGQILEKDILGNQRVSGRSVDIGAYEFQMIRYSNDKTYNEEINLNILAFEQSQLIQNRRQNIIPFARDYTVLKFGYQATPSDVIFHNIYGSPELNSSRISISEWGNGVWEFSQGFNEFSEYSPRIEETNDNTNASSSNTLVVVEDENGWNTDRPRTGRKKQYLDLDLIMSIHEDKIANEFQKHENQDSDGTIKEEEDSTP